METSKTKRIALLSIMLALTIVFCFVPVQIGPISLAVMILPVLIIAQVEDFKMTTILSFMMGCINLIAWYTTKAASPIAPIFQNPIICIVPRTLVGVVAWLTSHGLKKLIKPSVKKGLQIILEQGSIILSTALGVMSNTVFVGIFTLLFYNNSTLKTGVAIDIEYILAWFGLNFAVEVIAFSLLVPLIVRALKKAKLAGVKPINKQEVLNDVEDVSTVNSEEK